MTRNTHRVGSLSGTLVVLSVAMFLAAGCGHDQQLTLRSMQRGQTFSQPFTAAYCSRDGSGDTDVVLVDRAAEGSLDGHQTAAPVRQVMHIRVLWQPMHDTKADHPSASNATIHWYVMGNTPERSADVLEYAGTAFVVMNGSEDGTELTIRNASVQPVACRGELCDPVGTTAVAGTIHAGKSPRRVRQALSDVRTDIAVANSLTPSASAAHVKAESPSSLVR